MNERVDCCTDPEYRTGLEQVTPMTNPTTPVTRYNINIEPLNRGFVVRVGCQSLAILSKKELVKLFNAYMENPEKVEKEWMGEGKLPE